MTRQEIKEEMEWNLTDIEDAAEALAEAIKDLRAAKTRRKELKVMLAELKTQTAK